VYIRFTVLHMTYIYYDDPALDDIYIHVMLIVVYSIVYVYGTSKHVYASLYYI
jgi:hypothetical protein